MTPNFSLAGDAQGRFVAALYGTVIPAAAWTGHLAMEALGPTQDPRSGLAIVDALFRAWTARFSDSAMAERALEELGPTLPALPGGWRAMAAVVRAEVHRMRGFPESALAEAETALRSLEPLARSSFDTEIRDFTLVLKAQCLADLGRLAEQRALLAQAPGTVADWQRTHQAGEAGRLLFVAATHFRALAGAPCAAADEPQAFRALLDEPVCPELVRSWGCEALASVDFRAGRYETALQWYAAAFASAQAAGSRRQMFVAALNIATCHGNLHAPQRAVAWARRALEVLPQGQWPVAEGLAGIRLSTALRVAGQPGAALLNAQRSCRVLEGLGPSRNRRVAWLAHGEALLAQGRTVEALERFDAVVAETEAVAENDLRVEALRGGAQAMARNAQAAQALPRLESALALARSMGSRPREAECLLARLEVWLALKPEDRAALGCDDGTILAALDAAESALRGCGLQSRSVECQELRARCLAQQGRHDAAAQAWHVVARSWQQRHQDDLAEQLSGLEELGRLRMAEQALVHAREQQALLASRLALTERQAAMLEMLEAFSRLVHAAPEPEEVFNSLQHHAALLLGARRLQLWVLDGAGQWVCRLGDTGGTGAVEQNGAVRVHLPLRVAGHSIGRISAELPMPGPEGLDRQEQRRVFGLVAEHASLVLRSWLETQRLRTASHAARTEVTRERDGRERAEKLIADKRRFLAQAGHELRTPLNAIMGFGQLLATNPELGDGPARAHALTIVRAGGQLTSLVDDLTELASLDAGSVTLTLEPLDVASAIAGAIDLLEGQARRAAIALRSAGECGLVVRADRLRLQQLLTNLVGNGIKYGHAGGRVTVSCQRDADGVRIEVDDDGIGVPEHARSGLFEPFNRMGRERSGIEGTGLGLSIVFRLAKAMGGRVAYSPLEAGSRFTVWLPAA